MQPVDERVRALEPAGALQVRVENNGANVLWQQLAGPAIHFGVAKAMECEVRLPRFDPATPQSVAVGGLRGPERARGQFAILQDLRVAQRDGLPGLSLNGYAEPAHKVLSEVNER